MRPMPILYSWAMTARITVLPAPTFRKGSMLFIPNRTHPFIAIFAAFLALNAYALEGSIPQIIDEPGLFKVRRLDNPDDQGFRYWSLFWRTDNELILQAQEYKTWSMQGGTGQRLFRWNLETNAPTEAPYVGSVLCITPDRILLRREEPDPADPTGKRLHNVLYGGEYWNELKRYAGLNYNLFTCEQTDRNITRDYGEDTYLTALRPGDGHILEGVAPLREAVWFIPEGSKTRIQIGGKITNFYGEDVRPIGIGSIFGPGALAWRNQYLLVGAYGDQQQAKKSLFDLTFYFLSPDGHVTSEPEPAQIRTWKKEDDGPSIRYAATKAGIIWRIAYRIRGRSKGYDGLYIERNGKLIRFLRNAELSSVSPNGCRMLATVDLTAKNFPHDGKTELQLIDFCEENRK